MPPFKERYLNDHRAVKSQAREMSGREKEVQADLTVLSGSRISWYQHSLRVISFILLFF
jgi:tyrosine-protein phosphatase YwqE